MCVKEAQDDNGGIRGDSKMYGKWEGVNGFNANVIVTDGGVGGQSADIAKENIEGVGKLEAEAKRNFVVIFHCLVNINDGIGREVNQKRHQGRLYFCFTRSQGCNCSGCACTLASVLRTASFFPPLLVCRVSKCGRAYQQPAEICKIKIIKPSDAAKVLLVFYWGTFC